MMEWYKDPIYIKQCEKAKEIQKDHKFKEGDYEAWRDVCDGRAGVGLYDPGEPKLYSMYLYIWLPTQSQLQEMLGGYDEQHAILDRYIYYDVNNEGDGGIFDGRPSYSYHEQFTSMEQLWLAFVMKERWNKIWSEGEWIETVWNGTEGEQT